SKDPVDGELPRSAEIKILAELEPVLVLCCVVLIVSADLSHGSHAEPVITDIGAIFHGRGNSGVFSIATANGRPLPTDHRESIGTAHWVVRVYAIELERVLPAKRQGAVCRRGKSCITCGIVKLACPARVGVRRLGGER